MSLKVLSQNKMKTVNKTCMHKCLMIQVPIVPDTIKRTNKQKDTAETRLIIFCGFIKISSENVH